MTKENISKLTLNDEEYYIIQEHYATNESTSKTVRKQR